MLSEFVGINTRITLLLPRNNRDVLSPLCQFTVFQIQKHSAISLKLLETIRGKIISPNLSINLMYSNLNPKWIFQMKLNKFILKFIWKNKYTRLETNVLRKHDVWAGGGGKGGLEIRTYISKHRMKPWKFKQCNGAHRETTRYRVQKQLHVNYVIKVALQISGERMFYSINSFETIALH